MKATRSSPTTSSTRATASAPSHTDSSTTANSSAAKRTPPPIEGLDGGLLSPTGDLPNGGIDRQNGDTFPLWRDFIQVEIYLQPEFFDEYGLDDFSAVSWQFGDIQTGVSIAAAIPLPTAAGMGMVGLALIGIRRRR